jgi:DUF1365 family protein
MGVNPAQLRSCLYECSVMHHRLTPKEHRFRYSIYMFYLDLDELDQVAGQTALFSRNGRNIYSFCDRDHLTLSPAKSIRENICQYLAQEGIEFPASGKISLLTLPRVFGYVFNPVSFYFCYDAAGAPICAIAEVGNTFREMKPFLVRHEQFDGKRFRLIAPKHFYVSPFSSLELKFDFKLSVPNETFEIHIDDLEGDRQVLLSSLSGTRVPLTNARLAWYLFKYPLVTLRVIFLIHWHALLLYWKKVPFHRKAANPELQQKIFNPHASIAETRTESVERVQTIP